MKSHQVRRGGSGQDRQSVQTGVKSSVNPLGLCLDSVVLDENSGTGEVPPVLTDEVGAAVA